MILLRRLLHQDNIIILRNMWIWLFLSFLPELISGFEIKSDVTHASVGDSVSLECWSTNVPVEYFVWGDPALIQCATGCEMNPAYVALYPEMDVKCRTAGTDYISTLIIGNIAKVQLGTWTCHSSSDTTTHTIAEFEQTTITQLTCTPDISEGADITCTCKTEGGNPGPVHKWYRNANQITPDDPQTNNTDDTATSTVTLTFNKGDSGSLRCDAEQVHNKVPVTESIPIDVKYSPTVRIDPDYEPYNVEKGTNVVLTCNVTPGNPPDVTITWKHDGNNLGETGTRLDLNDIQPTDDGTYTCIASNSYYNPESTRNVNVHFGPDISSMPEQVLRDTGLLSIKCEADGNPSDIDYKWTKVGDNTFIQHKQELRIPSVNKDDAGTYNCTAENTLTPSGKADKTVQSHETVSVIVMYAPGSALLGNIIIAELGSSMDITCNISDTGIPPAEYRWKKNETETTQTGNIYQLSQINFGDETSYKCIPYNTVGDGTAATVDVIVYDDPAKKIDLPSELHVINTDDRFSATCAFTAKPAATITWMRDGNPLTSTVLKTETTTVEDPSNSNYKITSSTITWNTSDDLKRKDAKGKYKCVAQHDYGVTQETTEMYLDVLYPPSGKPQLHVSSTVVSVVDSVIFQCDIPPEVEGNPSCDQYSYHLNDTEWTNNANIWTHKTDSVAYAGHYFCQSANALGATMTCDYIELQVHAPAVIENTVAQDQKPTYDSPIFNLSCIGSGNNRTITWQRHDDDIMKYFLPPEEEYVHGSYAYDQTTALKSVLRWIQPGSDSTCNTIDKHNGVYDCVVTALVIDSLSHYITSFTINVQHPALWNATEKTKITDVGGTDIFLYCDVCANPPPETFTWSRSGHGLRDGIRIQHDHIYFDEITSDDFGIYTCKAISTIKGTKYQNSFEIELVSAGSPEQPQLLQVLQNVTSVSLSVSWIPGHNIGYEQFFKVQQKNHMDEDFQLVAEHIPDNKNGESFTVTINNLDSAATYTIAVLAYNSWAGGVNYSTPALVTASTIDSPQIVIHDVLIGRKDASLYWSLDRGNVTKLRLQFQKGDSQYNYVTLRDDIRTTDNPIAASHDDLDPKQTYSFQLLYYEGDLAYTSNNGEVKWYHPPSGLSALEIAGIIVIILLCLGAVLVGGVIAFVYRRDWFSRFKDIKTKTGHRPRQESSPNHSGTPYENWPQKKPEMYEELSQAGVPEVIHFSEYASLHVDQNIPNDERKVYEELPL